MASIAFGGGFLAAFPCFVLLITAYHLGLREPRAPFV